jgi:hypothetical protein
MANETSFVEKVGALIKGKDNNDPKKKAKDSDARNDIEKRTLTVDSSGAQSSTPDDVRIGVVSAPEGPRPSPSMLTPTSAPAPARIKKGNRRGKNTTVVCVQMPIELVKVLDEMADAGAFRNRSDVILQAVRSFPDVRRRISKLETKRSPKIK